MRKLVLGTIILGTVIVSITFLKLPISGIFHKDSKIAVAGKNTAEIPAEPERDDENIQSDNHSQPSSLQTQDLDPLVENKENSSEEALENSGEIQKEDYDLHAIPFCNNHKIEEPSGIVYHSAQQSYFVVGDQGEIYRISQTGELEKKKKVERDDFEGITVNPQTGLLYVAVEKDEKIFEVDPTTLKVKRKFTIDRYFQGKLVLEKDGEYGIEGITYNPHTKTFFLTNQQLDQGKLSDASAVFEVEFPADNKDNQTLRIINYKKMPITDLSAISYDTNRSIFYVVSDINDTLITMDRSFNILEQTKLPGLDQEGLALTPEGNYLIAQDSGGIIKAVKKKKQSGVDKG